MDKFVFVKKNTDEPFTTSTIIAERAGVQHHTVTSLSSSMKRISKSLAHFDLKSR